MSSEWITTGTPGQHLTGPLKEKEKEVDQRKHGGEQEKHKKWRGLVHGPIFHEETGN